MCHDLIDYEFYLPANVTQGSVAHLSESTCNLVTSTIGLSDMVLILLFSFMELLRKIVWLRLRRRLKYGVPRSYQEERLPKVVHALHEKHGP
jgi:hypothetical protein